MEDKDTIFSDINVTEIETSYFQRLFTNLIDVVISILFLIAIYKLMPREMLLSIIRDNTFIKYIFIISVMSLYRMICLLFFSKTIGMLICKVKYLNGDLQPLSTKEKMIAVFAIRTSRLKYYKINNQLTV